MELDLTDRAVWITGASSGIGAALARDFAQRGARLVLSARREERLREVADLCGARDVALVPCDLAELARLPAVVEEVLRRTGGVDVMVHNAGVGQRSLASETRFEVDRHLIDVNYLAPVAITKALLPSMLMRKSGTFVVMSSVLGLFSAKRRSGYAASKHALHGFFDGLRAELSEQGIRVLTVCPGRVRTEFSEAAFEGDGSRHGKTDETSYAGITPERVAKRTLRALDAGADEIVVARWEHLPVLMKRASPTLLRRALARSNQT
jgi:short-subunit dehydrogenase